MTDSIALFACAKNEHNYITEWIYYHLKIGFDHIYICDTSDDNNMSSCTFKSDPRITLLHEPLHGKPFGHLQYCFQTKYNNQLFKQRHKWCAFIDIDEFIVLKKHRFIKDFLNSINFTIGSLGINWVLFGNNHHAKYINEPVVKRFTKCANKYNEHIKVIVDTNSVDHFNNQHFAVLSKGKQINEKGACFKLGPWQHDSSTDLIQVNHYVIKSTEEYNKRTAQHHCRDNNNSHFNFHNRNDITDLTAYNILYSKSSHGDINEFDYEFYVQYYNDLFMQGKFNKETALHHFNGDGKKEKRISNFNFNYEYYKANNKDLKHMNNIELWNHFKINGLKEGRKYLIN